MNSQSVTGLLSIAFNFASLSMPSLLAIAALAAVAVANLQAALGAGDAGVHQAVFSSIRISSLSRNGSRSSSAPA